MGGTQSCNRQLFSWSIMRDQHLPMPKMTFILHLKYITHIDSCGANIGMFKNRFKSGLAPLSLSKFNKLKTDFLDIFSLMIKCSSSTSENAL